MIERPKPTWPQGEVSPWKGKAVRPTVWEVAGAYPGRALHTVFVVAILSALVAAPIIAVLNWIAHATAGPSLVSASVLILIVWPSVAFGCWWLGMYCLIRGWMTEGDDA